MRLKIFRSSSMSSALLQVRETLGEDALILSSETLENGEVELSVALDDLPEDKEVSVVTRQVFPSQAGKELLFEWHGIGRKDFSHADEYKTFFARNISFRPLDLSPENGPVIVCGGAGSGKTLTVSRLMTRLFLAGISPHVMTMDMDQSSGQIQLTECADILGLKLTISDDLGKIASLCKTQGRKPVLIDTPAVNAFDRTEMKRLSELRKLVGGNLLLVHPAGGDVRETTEITSCFQKVGVKSMVVSKGDCSRRFGGIVEAGLSGISLSEISMGKNLIGDMKALNSESLHKTLLMKTDYKDEESSGDKINPFMLSERKSVLARHIAAQGQI